MRFVICFPYFGASRLAAIVRPPGVFRARRQLLLKNNAGIKIPPRTVTFGALVYAGRKVYFLSQRDLGCAQDTFFEKCEFLSKTNGNSSKRSLYDILKHENIQNPPRIISKTETLDFDQFDG